MQTNETQAPSTSTPATAQTVVLLSKEHDITAFASDDPSRFVIQGIHYNATAGCVEATNGRQLIRVPVERSEDFPPVSGAFTPASDVIIPSAPYKKALAGIPRSKTLPIIENVALSAVNGSKVRLTTNDLDNENSVVAKAIEGNYPRLDLVIPTKPPVFTIALSAYELRIIADYFARHSDATAAVTFQFTADTEPVRFAGTLASGKRATGVLIPCRLTQHPSYPRH